MSQDRSFREFREEGLLWLINTMVFHPRGYALAFNFDDDGEVTGWQLMGDGTEPWTFEDSDEIKKKFESVRKLLA